MTLQSVITLVVPILNLPVETKDNEVTDWLAPMHLTAPQQEVKPFNIKDFAIRDASYAVQKALVAVFEDKRYYFPFNEIKAACGVIKGDIRYTVEYMYSLANGEKIPSQAVLLLWGKDGYGYIRSCK